MKICKECEGVIAEAGKVYSFAGTYCQCTFPKDDSLVARPFMPPQDQLNKPLRGSLSKPSISHIINLCEQLPKAELGALVNLLRELHARD